MGYFYLFSHFINGIPVYERSVPVYAEWRAKQRIEELKSWYGYSEAFYTTDLPKDYWY
jgi:hypothetical protein